MILIGLTAMQRNALTMILIDHMRRPESTREWIDIVHNETVTMDDLVSLITRGNPFLDHFEREVLPEMMSSDAVIIVLADSIDSKLCLEIGAAVMLSKRILVLSTAASVVPEMLRRIADRIVVVAEKGKWESREARARIEEAISEFFGPMPERGKA